MLINTFHRRLTRGRLLVPVDFATLYARSGATPSISSQSIELFTRDILEHQVTEMEHLEPVSEYEEVIATVFATMSTLSIDDNRIMTLPPEFLDHLNVTHNGSLMIVAVGRITKLVSSRNWSEIVNGNYDSIRHYLCSDLTVARTSTLSSSEADLRAAATEAEKHSSPSRRFEQLVAEIFVDANIGIVELTQPSKDAGIDVIIRIPKTDGIEILYVQCKSGDCDVRDLRELIGVVGRDGAHAGLLVTLGKISAGAAVEAVASKIRVAAVNLPILASWIEARMIETRSYLWSGRASTVRKC